MSATVIPTEHIWMGYDPGRGTTVAPQSTYSYLCSACGRIEHSPYTRIPEGWDIMPIVSLKSGIAVNRLLCNDCLEQEEQKAIERLREKLAGKDMPGTREPARVAIAPPEPRLPASPAPFSIGEDRQADGTVRIAMTPETVLMRCNPLGFFLTPPEARALASALRLAADKAERPPYLGGGEQ